MTQKCDNCAAPMTFTDNHNGTGFFKCSYCGNILNVRTQQQQSQPQSILDKVFSFARGVIPNNNEELSRLHAERDKLMAIINDPSSTKDAIKFAKKQLRQITYEINIR